MSHWIRSGSSLLVGMLALALGGALAHAQPQEGKPAAAEPAAKAPARAPRGHLWWNDDELVAKLSLSAEQRQRMDAAYEKFQKERANPAKAREAFHTALRQGRLDEARRELTTWAGAESAQVSAAGGMKLDILSVLDAEQRKQLQASNPNLVNSVWVPRPAWKAAPQRAPVQR